MRAPDIRAMPSLFFADGEARLMKCCYATDRWLMMITATPRSFSPFH